MAQECRRWIVRLFQVHAHPTTPAEKTQRRLQATTTFNWYIKTDHDSHTHHPCTDQESKQLQSIYFK